MKCIVCSSLSMGAVGHIRSMCSHDEGSARKLAGAGCSDLLEVHKDRGILLDVSSIPKGRGGHVKM